MNPELEAFKAGWDAAMEFENHEWGPQPPSNPRDAFIQWKNTCENGHLTFEIDDPNRLNCPECKVLKQRGEFHL